MADEFELVNTGMGGELAERLAVMRTAGASVASIAQTFTGEGYPISRETVRRWLIRVGLPTKLAPGPSSGPRTAPGTGDSSISGSSSETLPASPSAGARATSPGDGALSPVGPVHGLPAGPVAPPAGGARSGGSLPTEQRSA